MQALAALWEWIQSNSSGISIILSLLGFLVVWLQLRKTRSAAEAAEDAARSALETIAEADTIADLATIRAGMGKVQVALRGRRFEAALIEAQSIRERLSQVRTRQEFNNEKSQTEMQLMVGYLKKLQDKLEKDLQNGSTTMDVQKPNSMLGDFQGSLAKWIEEMRFRRRERKS